MKKQILLMAFVLPNFFLAADLSNLFPQFKGAAANVSAKPAAVKKKMITLTSEALRAYNAQKIRKQQVQRKESESEKFRDSQSMSETSDSDYSSEEESESDSESYFWIKKSKKKSPATGTPLAGKKIQKRYFCPEKSCSKSYASSYILKEHRRVHNGTLLKCSECDTKFEFKSVRVLHLRNMHNIDARKKNRMHPYVPRNQKKRDSSD